MIKTVIFDIGNVLAAFGWENLYREFGLTGDDYEKMANATVRHPAWLELDRGAITTEEAIELFAKEAPEFRHYIERVYEDLNQMLIQYDYAIPWIKELKKKGYRIYILSNWSKPGHEQCMDTVLSFLPLVDGAVFSFQELVIKPDQRIYDILCKRYDINPSEAVFLDDGEKNVIAAREYGLHAIHFTSYEQGRAELEALLSK